MSAWADQALALIAANPHWASAIVFIVAAAESIVLAGYVVPGTVILFGVGGIAAVGELPLMPILVWAAAGAVAGDGFSYWLGRRYRHSLRGRWPFTRYPGLIERGEAFFHRHGAKSIVIGRFVPVLKPIIPVVAGIVGMPPARFYAVNVLSAVIWSPAHILPGVLAGASLHLLQGVSPRLAVAVVLLIAAVVAVWLLARLLILRLIPLALRWFDRLLAWTQRRPGSWLQRIGARFDPSHPAASALALTYGLLLAAVIGFLAVLEDVLEQDALVRADRALSTLIEGVRNPWFDPLMIAISSLCDALVTTAVALSLIAWLVWRRQRALALATGLAIALTAASLPLMKLGLQIPRPNEIATGFDAFSFPSGHTTMAAAVYGLAAWLVAGGFGVAWRPAIYLAAAVWMSAMALSRVYLGAHWPSDVAAGLCLGLLAPLTVAALHHGIDRLQLGPRLLAAALVFVFAVSGAWHVGTTWDARSARYAVEPAPQPLDVAGWWAGAEVGPAHQRIDLGGELEEAFAMQWLGDAETLGTLFVGAGWSTPPDWTLPSAIGYLRTTTPITELPVLPRLAGGRTPVVTLTRPTGEPDRRWILRAWRSGYVDVSGRRPLLLVSIVEHFLIRPAQVLTLAGTAKIGPARTRALLRPVFDGQAHRVDVVEDADTHTAVRAMTQVESTVPR